MNVTIYSTTTCPYCKMLKDYLTGKSIQFVEKLVDLDEAAKTQMLADSGGFLGVPFSVFTKDDGTRETVIGFDRNKINQLLQINTNEHQ